MSNEHWTDYWKEGRLTSLPQDFRFNYDCEIESFWVDIIETLKDGSSVLDVCTGNLAIPLLLQKHFHNSNKNLNTYAADLARIDKKNIVRENENFDKWLENITIFDESPIETISEKIKEPIDLITSQYGIEYCDIEKVAPEINIILKPGGRLVFIAHSSDTSILKTMKDEKIVFDVLVEIKAFEVLNGFGLGEIKPANFLKNINKIKKKINSKFKEKPHQLLQVFQQVFETLSGFSLKQLTIQKEAVYNFYQQHWMAQYRALDLLKVSQKISENPNWYHPFEREGLILKTKKIIKYQGIHNAGTAFEFIKPI